MIRIYFTQEKDHSLRDSHKQIRRLEDEIKELVTKNDGKEVQMKVNLLVILEYILSIKVHPKTVNKKLVSKMYFKYTRYLLHLHVHVYMHFYILFFHVLFIHVM